MGKSWDGQKIAFSPSTWKALAQHLLPGAFGMAFASSRGYHRLACALEDAGLMLHPTIFLWTYGAGFPKATRIAHEDFTGHRYGGQALKPAAEPILCFQTPYAGRPVDRITETGAGALWIEGGRVGTAVDTRRPQGSWPHNDDAWEPYAGITSSASHGRWPPNFALTHLPACRPLGFRHIPGNHAPGHGEGSASRRSGYGFGAQPVQHYVNHDGTETVQAYACAPECPVRRFDAQAGPHNSYQDAGPVSRFFPCFDWALDVAEHLAAADPVFYAGKASPSERLEGLRDRNTHPTVKPLALCKWLATLLLPPQAYAPRRLLNPFAGSGSEAIGATLAGWEIVAGIEQDPATVTLAQQRFTYWHTQIAAQLSLDL
jgi:site-specific DNA-methyltransferase (adenine-specific)